MKFHLANLSNAKGCFYRQTTCDFTFVQTETRILVHELDSTMFYLFLLLRLFQGLNLTPSLFWLIYSALSSFFYHLLVISTSPIQSITAEEYCCRWWLHSWPHPLVGNVPIPIQICRTIFHFHEKASRPSGITWAFQKDFFYHWQEVRIGGGGEARR